MINQVLSKNFGTVRFGENTARAQFWKDEGETPRALESRAPPYYRNQFVLNAVTSEALKL